MIQLMHLPVEQVTITSGFGLRVLEGKREFHNGLDLAPRVKNVVGDKLYAVMDGIVVVSKAQGTTATKGYGNYIVIEHEGFCTLYGHMKALGLPTGTQVKVGQVIGFMGNTGNSTGIHTHFEMRVGKYDATFWKSGDANQFLRCMDPKPYIDNYLKYLKEGSIIPKTKTWLQRDGEAAIRRLDLLKYGNGIDLLNAPERWIEIINDPALAAEQFKDTSDMVAFIFIMLDRISQKSF